MSFPRTQTPTLPPMYENGQILTLRPSHAVMAAKSNDPSIFKAGDKVTVVGRKDISTTETTAPLSSATASYKVKVQRTVLVEAVQDAIQSKRVHHFDLLVSVKGGPGPDPYTQGDVVYLKRDIEFPRFSVVKVGTKVIIGSSGATTNTGGTIVRRAKDAYYQIKPVRMVQQQQEFVSGRYVLHSELV